MIIFIAAVVAFLAGLIFGGYLFFSMMMHAYTMDKQYVLDTLEKASDSNDKPLKQEPKFVSGSVEILIEQHGTKFIGWMADSGVFVSQGITIEEVLKLASERFPGTEFTYTVEGVND